MGVFIAGHANSRHSKPTTAPLRVGYAYSPFGYFSRSYQVQQVWRALAAQVLALGRLLTDSATATGGTGVCEEEDAEHGHQCLPRLGLHRCDLLLASQPNGAG